MIFILNHQWYKGPLLIKDGPSGPHSDGRLYAVACRIPFFFYSKPNLMKKNYLQEENSISVTYCELFRHMALECVSRIINAKKKSIIHPKRKTKGEMDSVPDYTLPCQGKKCHPNKKHKSATFCDNITKLNIMCIAVN